jgi:hypothetical protein
MEFECDVRSQGQTALHIEISLIVALRRRNKQSGPGNLKQRRAYGLGICQCETVYNERLN